MSWLRDMSGDAVPPQGLADWAATQPSAVAAWRDCPRPDWQLWLAGHIKGRTHQDERTIIAAGMTLFPDSSFISDILQYASPIPTERDTLDAWSRDAIRSLTMEQRLIASSAAFFFSSTGETSTYVFGVKPWVWLPVSTSKKKSCGCGSSAMTARIVHMLAT